MRLPAAPEIGRVIFISGPHRGSEIASSWLGRFGSSLVKAPINAAWRGQRSGKGYGDPRGFPEAEPHPEQRRYPRAE